MNLPIYAAGVRTFLRPISSPLSHQCRSIHLLHAATSETALKNHELQLLKPAAPYKDPMEIEIDLWAAKPGKHIGRITLKKALTDYIKPGTALLPPRQFLDPTDKSGDPARYYLTDLNTEERPSVKDKQKRVAKEFHFHVKTRDPELQRNQLRKAYFFLANGVNVEFHIHSKKPKKKGEMSNTIPFAQIQNLLENVSLRPDVIGKALPQYSGTIVLPQDLGSEVCWVVSGKHAKHGEAAIKMLARDRKKSMSFLKRHISAQMTSNADMPLKEGVEWHRVPVRDESQW
jgi:hypothetical protein